VRLVQLFFFENADYVPKRMGKMSGASRADLAVRIVAVGEANGFQTRTFGGSDAIFGIVNIDSLFGFDVGPGNYSFQVVGFVFETSVDEAQQLSNIQRVDSLLENFVDFGARNNGAEATVPSEHKKFAGAQAKFSFLPVN